MRIKLASILSRLGNMSTTTIVTVVKEHERGLRKTIESVLAQDYSSWNLVVIVGTSNDRTLEVAHNYQSLDLRIQVEKEIEAGIYPSMNQGLQSASGEYCCFLNAGDTFASISALSSAVSYLQRTEHDFLLGRHLVESSDLVLSVVKWERYLSANFFMFTRKFANHQAMLFRTDALRSVGGYSTRYKYASDFEAVIKILKVKKGLRIGEVLAVIEPDGVADRNILDVLTEKHKVRTEVGGSHWISILSFVWTVLAKSKIRLRKRFFVGVS